jgi:hypothetical protein
MKKRCSSTKRRAGRAGDGFTRVELILLVAGLGLLGSVSLPMLADTKPRSHVAVCLSNLHVIGQAFLSWDTDHDGADPWHVEYTYGGTQFASLANNAWFQFAPLSNQLSSPKVFACPGDTQALPASEFSASAAGGLFHPTFGNLAISYFIGLRSSSLNPQSILAGDRSMTIQGIAGYRSDLNPTYLVVPRQSAWLNTGLHGATGNLLFHDGRVELLGNDGLKRAWQPRTPEDPSWNILLPRPPLEQP